MYTFIIFLQIVVGYKDQPIGKCDDMKNLKVRFILIKCQDSIPLITVTCDKLFLFVWSRIRH